MKKLLISGGVVAASLIGIFSFWLTEAIEANASQFDHSVSVALFSVADTMSEKATVEKRSPNLFYVSTNSAISNKEIDTLIQQEFDARGLRLDYEIGIYNAEDDSLVYGNYIKASDTPPASISNCDYEPDLGVNKNFAVLFPARRTYLYGQMNVWFLVVAMLALFSWIYYYIKNHTTNARLGVLVNRNQIRLGETCLDFHNQSLEVENSTYRLTYKENQILKLLFENPNQIINREVFLETIWEKDGFFVARSMDVFISKVRKYLSADDKLKIENLRSIGYRLHVKK
ncbi:winged helix-turn-helix domain-containing protein [Ekhidna sp.]